MTVTVDAVVYFNVVTAELALCSVDDYRWGSYSVLLLGKEMLDTRNFEEFGLLCKAGLAKRPITFP